MTNIKPAPIKNKMDSPTRSGISEPWRKFFATLQTQINQRVPIVSGGIEGNVPMFTSSGTLEDSLRSFKKYPSVTYTDTGANLTTAYFGKVIKFENGIHNVICNLPSVGTDDIDSWIIIMRLGTGELKILAADSDTIESSTAGGGIVCNEAGRVCANVTLYLASQTKWAILAGIGIWPVI